MSKRVNLNVLYTMMMVALLSFSFPSCSSDDDTLNDGSDNTTDVAVTSSVTKLGVTYAHIDGYVNLNLITSSYTNQQIGIELAMTEDFINAKQAKSKALEGNKLTVVIDTLSAETKYYYRTFVKINDLNYYGEKRSFTTKDIPNITSTGDTSDLTFTSANINCKADVGSIDKDNKFSIGVVYGTTKNRLNPDSIVRYMNVSYYGYGNPVGFNMTYCSIENVKNNSYNVTISGLQTGKTYYYCSFVRAGNKYKLGDIKSFTTKSLTASQLSTGDASEVTLTSATIISTSTISNLYPKGTSMSYGVRYSTTKEALEDSYVPDGFVYYGYDEYGYLYYNPTTGERRYLNVGSYQTTNSSSIDGNTFTTRLSGLTSGATYYYCAYVSVDGVFLTGELKSFTTKLGNSYLSTEDATEVTLTSAKLNGKTTLSSLYSNKESNIQYFIRYSTKDDNINNSNNNYGNYNSLTPNKDGNNLSTTLSNLQPNTTYYFCVVASVDGNYICGDVKRFTTKSWTDYLKTDEATDITMISATLKGSTTLSTIYPNSTSIQYYIRYSTSNSNLKTSNNSSSLTVTKNGNNLAGTATNLKSETTYYYCVVAYVDGLYIYGETKNFTTKSGAEYLQAGETSNITLTSATIKGTTTLESVYNNGSSIQYRIMYGTNSNLTSSPSSSTVTPKQNGTTLTAELTNLAMATTYYYCVRAYVNGSYVYSDTKSFVTKDIQQTGFVDLGVSCQWATFNLGAKAPEDYGDYYAWGETETRTFFYTSNYSHYEEGIGNEISGSEFDAARIILGSPWRLPTGNEYQELLDKCRWEEINYKNVTGYLVTGKNGNAIFLPKAGYKKESKNGNGYAYWSGSYYNYKEYAFGNIVTKIDGMHYSTIWAGSELSYMDKYCGLTIRPVR